MGRGLLADRDERVQQTETDRWEKNGGAALRSVPSQGAQLGLPGKVKGSDESRTMLRNDVMNTGEAAGRHW